MPGGVDYSDYDRQFDEVRRTGKPPVVVRKPPISSSPTSQGVDLRPKASIVGRQGEAKVVQHPDGSQTVVGEQGLKDLGIKSTP